MVELPEQMRSNANRLSIKLCGESSVPEVIMLEPALDKRTGKSKVNFGRCLIEEKASRSLSFKNVGKISARIIVRILDDNEMIYRIRSPDDIFNETKITRDSEKDNRSIICALSPNETVRLFLDFQPKRIGDKKAQIHFHVMDNPYESLTLDLEGEGFTENVIFENLPLVEIPKPELAGGANKSKKSLKNRGTTSRASESEIFLQLFKNDAKNNKKLSIIIKCIKTAFIFVQIL